MSRAPGLCRRCGGPKRGRAARDASPWAQCGECSDLICERHSVWSDGWICTKCDRGKKVKPKEKKEEDVQDFPYRLGDAQ